jgi:hypothetical protein
MRGKFGRVLGDFEVYYHSENRRAYITSILIKEGHAVTYEGGNKDELIEQHKQNRRRLIDNGKVVIPDGLRHLL